MKDTQNNITMKKTSKIERLREYQNATFKFYETARHGYLLVPKELILDFGLEYYISPFSFETMIDKKKWVYLEEDSDASTFLQSYNAYYGKQIEMDWIESLEDDNFITNNKRFGSQMGADVYMFRIANGINNLQKIKTNLEKLSKKHQVILAEQN
jgi:hypothetical protein